MNSSTLSYSDIIINMLNDLLMEKGLVQIDRNSLGFILDEVINRTKKPIRISGEEVLDVVKAEEVLQCMLKGGPSWLHVHIMATNDAKIIVSLRAGAPVGAPKPSINMSMEYELYGSAELV